jgi:type I restriction enzyme S subunit
VNVDEIIVEKFSVSYGDILFQRSSETREEVGTANVYLDKNKNATFGGFVIRGKKIGDYNPIFFNKLLKTNSARENITSKSGGSTRFNVGQEILSSVNLYFPNLCEQEKIASFLSLVDERIQTQKKIIEGLITQKNYIIKKLFEQNLSDLNTRLLSDFLKIPDKIKPDFIDKKKLLTVKLHLKGVHKNENSDSLSLGATNYFIRKKGQFIYGKQNLFNGAFALIPDKYDGFLSSADVPTLDINESIVNAKYLFYFFSRESYYKKLEDIASGSGSKRIHENTLMSLKIVLPSLTKQNKIANLLSKLDEKINLEDELLTQYENQKKYLLQNLFV